MNCPRCASDLYVKNGMLRGRQRYLCKSCSYQFSVEKRCCDAHIFTKELAIKLHLEGMGLRAIGRTLGFSNVTILRWIKKFAAMQPALNDAEKSIPVMEIDEMHTYVGSKKKPKWVWIAVDRLGKKFVDFQIGDRSQVTGKSLWQRIKNSVTGIVATDHWAAYESFVPEEIHVQSKAETFTVEGYNSLLRHFLARFIRRTKCYSKSVEMLKISIRLLMLKRNGDLSFSR